MLAIMLVGGDENAQRPKLDIERGDKMGTIQLVTEIPGPKSLEMVRRREAATAAGATKLTQVAIAKGEGTAALNK